MSKAAELAALIGSQTALSNRNLISNCSMCVYQRGSGTLPSGTSLTYYGPDRWRVYKETSTAVATLSQDTDVPSGQGFKYSYKIDVTTADASVAAGDRCDMIYRFEGQDLQQLKKGTSSAESLTLQFWVKSPKTGTHICEMFDADNSRQISKAYTVNTADTWEYKTITFEGDTTGAYDADNANSMQISWWLIAGSTYSGGTLNTSWASNTNANRAVGQVNVLDDTANNFLITGVQLEVGEQATPFEHRSFGDEMTRCERYFQRFVANDAYTAWSVAFSTSATSAKAHLKYNGKMRAEPTISQSNTGFNHGPQVAFSSFNTLYTGLDLTWIDMNIGNVSAANVLGHWNANANTAAYVQMDAEL